VSETLIGRSNQSYWPLLWIAPGLALTATGFWSSLHVDSFWRKYSDPGSAVDWWLPIVAFAGFWLLLLLCLALVLWRRWNPANELVIDSEGIASNLIWGRGRIAWPDIARLEYRNTWMHVFGTDVSGKKRKLIVNLYGLDKPLRTILGAIGARRPDLFPPDGTP